MKALVVDDSAITRRILVNTLQSIGFTEILEATDGKSALDQLSPGIELIITDWNMPGMAGIELTRTLRQDPEWAKVPILLVTARNMRPDVIEAAQAGVSGYIVKPFTRDMLRTKIEEIMPRDDTATGTDG